MPRRREERPAEPDPVPLVARLVDDPRSGGLAEIRRIQPFQARKTYLCPGCNNEILPGTGHVVVVPLNDPPARRHWHTPCFSRSGLDSPRG
jgi:hypothetical protein